MKKSILAILGLTLCIGLASCDATQEPGQVSSNQETVSSTDTSSNHTHVYGDLVDEVLPSYFYDGKKAYYYCSECKQYFDADKNPVTEDSLILPKATDDLAISINGVEIGTFTLIDKQENEVNWEYKNLSVVVDDVVTLTKPGDSSYIYKYFGGGNLDQNGKVLTTGKVDIDLWATPNGFQLTMTGYKYQGLVVKINDEEYPLAKVTYYESDKETYIYGYHPINVGDTMTVIDNVNNIVYDYDDLENDTKWNTFDFHKGTNNEIVFDYKARYGIEFDRGGDKLISITKTFEPRDGDDFQVHYSSDKAPVDLEEMIIGPTHELYEEISWYINHQEVKNCLDIADYINNNGYHAFYATINFAKNEMFNLKYVTRDYIIKADHLVSVFADSTEGLVTISGDYIKVLEDATITVFYAPYCDAISLYFSSSSGASDAYIYLNGNFVPVEINNNVITYNNFHADQYDTISFVDGSYQGIEFTLASGYDATVLYASTTSGTTVLMFFKAGTFSVSLDLSTHTLTVTIVELDGAAQTGTPTYLSGKGGLYKTLVDNPENADEVYASNVSITGASEGFYIAFYDGDLKSIEDLTIDADSSSYGSLMMGMMIYITQDGTYNIYIHKTSHVVRLVKTA